MGGLFNRFTSRMVLGELLIHGLLASIVFILLLPSLEQHLKNQFINTSLANASQLAGTLEHFQYPPSDIDSILNGNLSLIHLNIQDGSITRVEADAEFGDRDDNVYHIAVPLLISEADYILQLGYDETATSDLIASTRQYGLIITAGYILLAVIIATIIGPQLTRPLVQLGNAARKIASGNHARHLEFNSNIHEIKQLSNNLELMRGELVDQREALATREARLSTIMANVIEGLITIDSNGKIISFNLAAERIFGYTASEVVGQDIQLLFSQDFSVFINNTEMANSVDQIGSYETQGRRKHGDSFHLEASVNQVCQLDGCIYIVICRDITERKQAEAKIRSLQTDLEGRVIKRTQELAGANKELKHLALHDSLTSLPNRVLLQDRMTQAIRTAKRDEHSAALLLSDLDRFKEVNDTLGHHYGDLLLQQVAVRLRSVLRDSDTVARLGGDEFAILLPNVTDQDQIILTANKIVAAIAAPFIFEDQNIHIGISIGVAICPGDSDKPSTLMRQADVAMYVAKRSNTDIAFYKPELDEHSIKRLSMAGELRRGLQQKQLVVHYQPNIDLRLNRVVGVEALVRWQHPEKGLILPDEFIPLAEHSGHIRELTAFVLEESLHQLHLWNSTGLTLQMSINLSGRSLHDSDLCDHIAKLLDQWQIKPEHLQLEITERALMYDPTQANKTLSQLDAMGVKLSIDDFGTGYSSLAYLKQLPIHEIKIDKSFVHAMLEQDADKVIVRSTIDLAHNMGHQVIAEGVDSEAVLNLLREMGCDLAQGYHINKPSPAEELRQWLLHCDWSADKN